MPSYNVAKTYLYDCTLAPTLKYDSIDYTNIFLDYDNKKYRMYEKYNSMLLLLISMFVIIILSQTIFPVCDIWILIWSEDSASENPQHSGKWYLSVWFTLIFTIGILSTFVVILLSILSSISSYHMFMKTLINVLRKQNIIF